MIRKYYCLVIIAIVCAVVSCITAGAQSSSPSEHEIKAAFIYNFAKFVEWPARAFSSSDAPIIIGVIGDDPFGGMLEQTVRGKTANGRKLLVRHFDKIGECNECHILFICSSEDKRLSRILDKLNGSSVLTVGEVERFTRRGGIIGFVIDDNKVGFEINKGAAKRADLKISSKLLKLAKAVRD